jgi:hypothetical protein
MRKPEFRSGDGVNGLAKTAIEGTAKTSRQTNSVAVSCEFLLVHMPSASGRGAGRCLASLPGFPTNRS